MLAAASEALAKSVQPTHQSRRMPENPPVWPGLGAVPFIMGERRLYSRGAERGTVATDGGADIPLPWELPGTSVKPRSVTLSTRWLKTCLAIALITLGMAQSEHILCFRYLGN